MVSPDIKKRILDVIYKMVAAGEKVRVDAVRRESKASMGDVSIVVREWRLTQSSTAKSVTCEVPEAITKSTIAMVAQLWSVAQTLAGAAIVASEEGWNLERSKLMSEVGEYTEAVDRQTADTTTLQTRLAEVEAAAATSIANVESAKASMRWESRMAVEAARDAVTPEQVTAKLMEDLKKDLSVAIASEKRAREDAAALRGRVAEMRSQNETLIKTMNEGRSTTNARRREVVGPDGY